MLCVCMCVSSFFEKRMFVCVCVCVCVLNYCFCSFFEKHVCVYVHLVF